MQSSRQSSLPAIVEKPYFWFLFAFVVYFLLSLTGGSPFKAGPFAYFNYLADAFLHGQLSLRLLPVSHHDLSFYRNHYYLYWPPMPAAVLMPFVAVFGVDFSDTFFDVLLASANVALIAALLRAADRKGLITLDANYRTALVFFFTLGTVHVILAPYGQVWFTAQLLGFLFVSLAYLCALELDGAAAFFCTGFFIACAMLTRNHLIFTGIWPAYYLLSKNWKFRPKLFGYIILALMPPLIMGLLFLGYNYLRFGNPLNLGIEYHKMSPFFLADYKKYGAFNAHYIPINFYYQYIHYPILDFIRLDTRIYMGGSLFLLSPVFFYAFRGMLRERGNPNIWTLALSILTTSVPILLLMGTGWVQYGPRYTLDFTVPLLLLTAIGVQSTSGRLLFILTILSIVQYVPGIYLFASF